MFDIYQAEAVYVSLLERQPENRNDFTEISNT